MDDSNREVTPRNEPEHRLLEAQDGRLSAEAFLEELLGAQVFLPVQDDQAAVAGRQRSTRAQPLMIQDEEGTPILFTVPERAKEFLANFPGFGGVLTEFKGMLFKWVLEKIDQDLSIVINPSLDFEPGLGFRYRFGAGERRRTAAAGEG